MAIHSLNSKLLNKTVPGICTTCVCVLTLSLCSIAQESPAPHIAIVSEQRASISDDVPAINTTRAKWNNFWKETVGPLTWGGGAFDALFSHATNTDPKYGVNRVALGKRFGASIADIASQNFFGDFVVASAFRLDPRYHRMGEGHSLWRRTGYAISRTAVIRKDNGLGNTFNFSSVLGSAASSAFSNIYYPPPSRTRGAFLTRFAIDVADNGFVNLAPEFWPDFKRKVFRRRKHD